MQTLKASLFCLFMSHFSDSLAQNTNSSDIYLLTEMPNSFVHGDDSVVHFIKEKFNVCQHSKTDESIVLKFVIEPDGSQSNIVFITDTNTLIQNDVIRMFEGFPKWNPGIHNGKAVRSLRHLLIKCKSSQVLSPPYETPIFKN